MYPFEVYHEDDGQFYFDWDLWNRFWQEKDREYPCPMNKVRFQLHIAFPSDRLEDVYVHDWNPHHQLGNYHLSVYDCFYDNSDWSSIFEVYPMRDNGFDRIQSHILTIEYGHVDPWGEQVRLMSTSSNILEDSSHRYCYFGGKYWKVIWLLDLSWWFPVAIDWGGLDTTLDPGFMFITPGRHWGSSLHSSSTHNWKKEGF